MKTKDSIPKKLNTQFKYKFLWQATGCMTGAPFKYYVTINIKNKNMKIDVGINLDFIKHLNLKAILINLISPLLFDFYTFLSRKMFKHAFANRLLFRNEMFTITPNFLRY